MIFGKEIIAVLSVALLGLGGYVWYVEERLETAQQQVGALEAENTQLTASLLSSQEAEKQLRSEMELWRGLYGDLQAGYRAIDKERVVMAGRLKALQENQDVKEYVRCPMPDSLYDWVRQN